MNQYVKVVMRDTNDIKVIGQEYIAAAIIKYGSQGHDLLFTDLGGRFILETQGVYVTHIYECYKDDIMLVLADYLVGTKPVPPFKEYEDYYSPTGGKLNDGQTQAVLGVHGTRCKERQ